MDLMRGAYYLPTEDNPEAPHKSPHITRRGSEREEIIAFYILGHMRKFITRDSNLKKTPCIKGRFSQ